METESVQGSGLTQTLVVWTQKRVLGLSRHWLAYANLFWGVLIGLPWLAPVLMKTGATRLAEGIYSLYSFLCHQLADRSFFLFGPKWMYSYADLVPYTTGTNTFEELRAFIGMPGLGYKVAWSDRMVSLYGGILLGGLIFALLRRRFRFPNWWVLLWMTAPIVTDGVTHAVSDLSGIDRGFRYTNAWLAYLTQNALPASFYIGNELGSLNSWLRLITGLLAGLAVTWVLYPLLDDAFQDMRQTLAPRFQEIE